MSVVGHQPPPFFRRGLPASVKLTVYVALSLILLVSDLRFRYLDTVRGGVAVVTYPFQLAASTPAQFFDNSSNYFSSLTSLRRENSELKAEKIDDARRLLRVEQLEQENVRLRGLMEMRARIPVKTIAAEIVFTSPDPFSQRVILDKGSMQGIEAGLAVVDMNGMIGQVTRVFPAHAEVTMLTDKDQAIPIVIERSGMRAIMFGSNSGMLELRFLASNADVKPGDRILTSGLDGIFVPGLPIATVSSVNTDGNASFAQVLCTPLGKTNTLGIVLVVGRADAGQRYPQANTAQPDKFVPPPPVSQAAQSAPQTQSAPAAPRNATARTRSGAASSPVATSVTSTRPSPRVRPTASAPVAAPPQATP